MLIDTLRKMSDDIKTNINKIYIYTEDNNKLDMESFYNTNDFMIYDQIHVFSKDDEVHIYIDIIKNKNVDSWMLFKFIQAARFVQKKYGIKNVNFTDIKYKGRYCVDIFIDFYIQYLFPLHTQEFDQHITMKDMYFSNGYKSIYSVNPIFLYTKNYNVYTVSPFGHLFYGNNSEVVHSHCDITHLKIKNGMLSIKDSEDKILEQVINSNKNRYVEDNDILLYSNIPNNSISLSTAYNAFSSIFKKNYFYMYKEKHTDEFSKYSRDMKIIPQSGGHYLNDVHNEILQ